MYVGPVVAGRGAGVVGAVQGDGRHHEGRVLPARNQTTSWIIIIEGILFAYQGLSLWRRKDVYLLRKNFHFVYHNSLPRDVFQINDFITTLSSSIQYSKCDTLPGFAWFPSNRIQRRLSRLYPLIRSFTELNVGTGRETLYYILHLGGSSFTYKALETGIFKIHLNSNFLKLTLCTTTMEMDNRPKNVINN